MTAQAQTLATLRSNKQFLHSKPMRFFDENGEEIKRTKFDEIAEEVEKINKNKKKDGVVVLWDGLETEEEHELDKRMEKLKK
jgi:hypothetical protein